MSTRVTKQDLDLISDLIFDSYISEEKEFQKIHFTFRTLTTEERLDIGRKFRYATIKDNIALIINILSYSICYVEGQQIEKSLLSDFLFRTNSKIVFKFYEYYKELDEKANKATKFVDYFIETKESRNNWSVYKACYRSDNPFFIRKLNQYQYYWILMNVYKDSLENEKKLWTKVEYATNSICAFVNPKAYNKTKDQLSVVEQLEDKEIDDKQEIAQQVEDGIEKEIIEPSGDSTKDMFTTLKRLPDETPKEHADRVNNVMEKYLAGEMADEHDRLVRDDEIKAFKNCLRKKRKKALIEKTLHEKRGMRFDSSDVMENPTAKAALEEDAKLGFFYDGVSYLDIIRMKDFAALPKKEKFKPFDEVMSEEIDVKTEVDNFLKGLYEQNKSKGQGQTEVQPLIGSIEHETNDANGPLAESNNGVNRSDIIKNAAERAAGMKVDVNSVDLMKQRSEKLKRTDNSLEIRRKALNQIEKEDDQEDLDVIKFT